MTENPDAISFAIKAQGCCGVISEDRQWVCVKEAEHDGEHGDERGWRQSTGRASERLRALDGAANERPWWTERQTYGLHLLGQCGPDDYVILAEGYPVKPPATDNLGVIAALRNALPLIADVVEAAEALDCDRQAFGYGKEQHIPGQLALAESLTALREHLEGQ